MLGTIIRTALFTTVAVLGVNYLMKGMEDELDAEFLELSRKANTPNGSDETVPGETDRDHQE